ncbi:pentapeptide repeat-containing protein [Candidatus Haliotispira prima]|uniref:Pentapeptide repeat-containing protein n=1 Tax=Candidatus Haliotispira prima TaxID=3034016 RepID=A0ABY8MDR2_9SPIO|nr:pentapeptide repeat-containing protein [Candidatus Haliotispira prima]
MIVVGTVFLIVIILVLIYLEPVAKFLGYCPGETEGKDCPGKTEGYFPLVQALGFMLIAIMTLILTSQRNRNLDKQVENARKQTENLTKQTENLTKQTENLTKQTENAIEKTKVQDETRLDQQFLDAVKLLGDSSMDYSGREGAVYMLSALAQKSPDHTQRCVDMISSLNQWMGERIQNRPDYFRRNANVDEKNFSRWRTRVFTTDQGGLQKYFQEISKKEENQPEDQILKKQIENERLSQTVLKELEEIIAEFLQREDNGKPLNLNHRYICQINLGGKQAGTGRISYSFAKLQGAKLSNANLQRAKLSNAKLQGAYLWGANLQGAYLANANLQGAYLANANLQGAYLANAKLQGAYSTSIEMEGETRNEQFTNRIRKRTNEKADLSRTQQGNLKQEDADEIIKELEAEDLSDLDIKQHAIGRIKSAIGKTPNLAEAQLGSYTKTEADEMIKNYEKKASL